MVIKVNSKEVEIHNQSRITDLVETMQLPAAGVAVAVNNKLVTRADWDAFILSENDNIVIIKAACGG